MSGLFTSHYLAELLRHHYFDESTGVVELFGRSDLSVRLHFDRGMLYFGEGGKGELAEMLRSSGVVPDSVLEPMTREPCSDLDLASRLIEAKAITKEALAPSVRALLERALIGAFSWTSGKYAFTRSAAKEGVFDPDILYTFECILKGIEVMANFEPLKRVLLGLQGRVKLSQRIFVPVNRLMLKPHHGYILSRIDGSMRLNEIAVVVPPGEEDESIKFVYGLAVLGIIEFHPPVNAGAFSLREVMQEHNETSAQDERKIALIRRTAERMATQRAVEILELGERIDQASMKAAYERLKAEFRRDRFSERVREICKKELSMIDSRLTGAYLGLQVDSMERAGSRAVVEEAVAGIDTNSLTMRKEMVKTQAQEQQEQTVKLAEQYHHKAREYFAEKDFHNCIQFCKLSIKFNASNAAAYSLMGTALAKNPSKRWQRMAEEALQKACDLDPWNAQAHLDLGRFYGENGLDSRARRCYEKVLQIVPNHAEAASALRRRKR